MGGSAQVTEPALTLAVRQYLDHLAIERGLAPNSLSSYRRDLNRYLAFLSGLGVNSLDDITEGYVLAFLGFLREGDADHPPLAPSSAARTVVAVRGFHRFALLEDMTSTDPAADVRPPVPPRRLPKALSVAQVEELIAATGEGRTPKELRDRALLELLYGTGARISEAVSLDLDDVNQEASSLRLIGKGGKERVVPVGRYATDALDRYLVRARPVLAERGAGLPALFLNSRGGRLSRQSAWTVLRSAAERAHIAGDVSPHTLRHSFATHLLDGGADIRVVQELLGHASVTTTQIYTLVTVDSLREVYATAHPRARA
jgi:integrase/recombinase XerD